MERRIENNFRRFMKNFLFIKNSKERNFGLDLLRAIAITMVMITHSITFFPDKLAQKISFFIFDGVSIFFVLSGFLIGGIFIRSIENNSNIKSYSSFLLSFWKKRWLRTIPNYYFILTILIIIFLLKGRKIEINIYEYYFFAQNLAWKHPNFFPEAWSLSVEEWFYLIVPITILFFYAFSKKLERTIYFVSFSIILLITVLRYLKFQNIGNIDYDLEYRKIVLYRLDSIMYGVVASSIFHYHKTIWRKYKNIFFILGIVILLLNQMYLKYSPSDLYLTNTLFIVESISVMLILPFVYYLKINNKCIIYIIFHIAIISYSMYLINYSIVKYELMNFINWDAIYLYILKFTSYAHSIIYILKYLTFWMLTILISTLNYKYFELPIMRIRNSNY